MTRVFHFQIGWDSLTTYELEKNFDEVLISNSMKMVLVLNGPITVMCLINNNYFNLCSGLDSRNCNNRFFYVGQMGGTGRHAQGV